MIVSRSKPLDTADDAAEVIVAPVHATAAAALQMPRDAVSVRVPPLGSVALGVTTKVTPVGVAPLATPPMGVAEVQPRRLDGKFEAYAAVTSACVIAPE